MNKYINREISWLQFNSRVLQEARNQSVPLIERLRFLGIYSNNLDEFYKVRYASLIRSINFESNFFYNIIDDQKTEELLKQINKIVLFQQKDYDNLYNEAIENLSKESIYMVDDSNILDEHKNFIQDFFRKKLIQSLIILFWKPGSSIPQLKDGSFYLAIKILLSNNRKEFAFIEVQTDLFSRFIILPSIEGKKYFIFLEDIIRFHLKDIFSILRFESVEAYSIKVTRDAELSIDNNLQMSIMQSISEGIKDRIKGDPIRLVYDKKMSHTLLKYIKKMLQIDNYDTVTPGGKYHNKRDFMCFPNFGRNDLEYKTIKPIVPKILHSSNNYFKVISKKDILLYTPYHDYTILLKFLQKASIDPMVKNIKITIYRVADNSQVMMTLINAAKNGKEVTAVLELRARFDEEHNIYWSKILQSKGIKVIFGVSGLKVHSKICYIERYKQIGCEEQYGIISTGNFNEKTAKFYTDFILITSNPEVTNELKDVFKFFNKNFLVKKYKNLVLSPWQQRKSLINWINNEIKNKTKGLPAQINIKVNNLSDKEIIDVLYEASNKGVEVRLIIRGICSLVAGKKEFSKNIHAISVIDKFLEHSRVFWFKNAGDDKLYISSSDLMPRNLDHRIEISCPILDANLKIKIQKIFELGINDNVKGHRLIDVKVNEIYQINSEKKLRSQEEIYTYLMST